MILANPPSPKVLAPSTVVASVNPESCPMHRRIAPGNDDVGHLRPSPGAGRNKMKIKPRP